jgi:hypothetical protein
MHEPSTSTARRSSGILSKAEATCALSETSICRVATLPPWWAPDCLWALTQASATSFNASLRRARRTRLEPACDQELFEKKWICVENKAYRPLRTRLRLPERIDCYNQIQKRESDLLLTAPIPWKGSISTFGPIFVDMALTRTCTRYQDGFVCQTRGVEYRHIATVDGRGCQGLETR